MENLDDDRILNSFLTVILATLRSNFFQLGSDGKPKTYLSFKLNSREIGFLPLPRPMVEIHSILPRVEGIHLRGGKVARGGLRWSDRMEISAPRCAGAGQGADGQECGDRAGRLQAASSASSAAGQRARSLDGGRYRMLQTFIRGLLDLTDNLLGNEIAPPLNVKCGSTATIRTW